jgi:RsiW-degrading membrane proteinase PrsW (M82 family)
MPMILLLVAATLAGAIVLVSIVASSFAYTGSVRPALFALLFAAIPAPALIAGVLLIDRLEPEPLPELALAFLWGAGGAILLAGTANGIGFDALSALAVDATDYFTATLVAPVTEEVVKGALLLGYLRLRRHHLDSITDGLMYAAMVALGFATAENATYYLDAMVTDGAQGLGAVFVIRGLLSPLAHPIFTSMIGIGVAIAATRRRRWWAPLLGLVAAIGLHGLWNGLVGLGEVTGRAEDSLIGLLVAYAALFVVLVGLIVVLLLDRRRLVSQLRTHLAPYVSSGMLRPAELESLTTTRARRQVRSTQKARHGAPGIRAARRFQTAATDLALLHRRIDANGRVPAGAEAERQHLVAQLALARTQVQA